jgi:GT2 family glycosyltransferase
MGHVRVSVIINTLDRADQLALTLLSLMTLRYPAFEVVVVHGPCQDHTADVLSRFAPAIRIGACPEANLAMSRNIGLTMARGEIVAFLDDDAIPEPDWLDRLAPAFDDPAVGGAGGFIRDHDGVRFQHQVIVADRFGEAEKFAELPADLGAGRYFSPTGTNVAVRRAALLAIGGFDEEFAYFLDETDVNLRLGAAGWRLVSIPAAEVHHKFAASHLRSANRVPRSLYLIARSKSYFCWVHASGSHSAEDIERELRRFAAEHGQKIDRFLKRRRIDAPTASRLATEVEQGLADGKRDATAPPRLLPPDAADQATDGSFLPFASTAQRPRIRVCLISHHWRWNRATRRVAADLAARGHEVTVIRSGRGPRPYIEFRDGMWIHVLVPPRATLRQPKSWKAALPSRSRFAAAAAAEIGRIQPRRQFQILAGAAPDIAALRRHDLPATMTAIGALEQHIHALEVGQSTQPAELARPDGQPD